MRQVILLLALLSVPAQAQVAPPAADEPAAGVAAAGKPPAAASPAATAAAAQEAPEADAPATPPATTASRAESERQGIDDEGYRVSLSLPTEDDRTAWLEPGLRVELGIERGMLRGPNPAMPLTLTTFRFRPRVRLDRHWSLAANLGYAAAGGNYAGLRWSALLEPTYHPLPSLGLSLGLGYGGLLITRNGASPPPPGSSGDVASRTLASADTMYMCNGGGLVSQVRLEYLFVVGQLFSTGPYLVADAQWTECTESFGNLDRETGQAALGRQWWLNLGGALGWWFSWR